MRETLQVTPPTSEKKTLGLLQHFEEFNSSKRWRKNVPFVSEGGNAIATLLACLLAQLVWRRAFSFCLGR